MKSADTYSALYDKGLVNRFWVTSQLVTKGKVATGCISPSCGWKNKLASPDIYGREKIRMIKIRVSLCTLISNSDNKNVKFTPIYVKSSVKCKINRRYDSGS